ncbi:hybrid sensor histidine kinase/response regulator [Chitinophaga nivalis]|uniref:histidine kinase n=1 Tax=Chitinophaga nivalis TaxID=2991709 RepID=A0ABT3IK50_9BACT|nr:hybrid sensor histidine kinase/response regulator [Chitinophaga nivalis]MCW3466013.1 hybrid sensor histidine kinase/response regulator [Chitinophaga nivalis]MCW3484296.1 hybrid sensor histidine kinase/response regulator [Chitinophaga nivalis]
MIKTGTASLEDEEMITRITFVNKICVVISVCILIIAPVVYFLTPKTSILIAIVIEFLVNNMVLFLNYKKWYKTAALTLFFLQCAAVVYFGTLMGAMLQLQFMVLFLISIIYLIFKETYLRKICLAAAILTLVLLETSYYYTNVITVSSSDALVIQSLAITGVMILILMVSKTYVVSNDSNKVLEKSNYFKRMFISKISHELRNSLAKTQWIAGLLKQDIQLDKPIHTIAPLVELLNYAASNAANIVNSVLSMSQIEAGIPDDIQRSPVVLKDFLQKIIAVDNIAARSRSIKIQPEIDPAVPEVMITDAFRLKEIVTNLLGNALKYSFRETTILLKVTATDSVLTLAVTNTGYSIPPDLQEKIFHAFTTHKGHQYIEGTGLGLFIVQNTLQQMSGTIRLDSNGPVTTFTITLPLVAGDPAAIQPEEDADTSITEFFDVSLHVLLADDDPMNTSILEKALQRIGCKVKSVHNGKEVLTATARYLPDIIILDNVMPEMDGIETVRHLKANARTKDIPVIIATAEGLTETLTQIKASGADAIMTKPYSINELKKHFNTLIPPVTGQLTGMSRP